MSRARVACVIVGAVKVDSMGPNLSTAKAVEEGILVEPTVTAGPAHRTEPSTSTAHDFMSDIDS